MRALLCRQFGSIDSLEVVKVNDPTPNVDEVVIKVEACSVNFPDLLIIQNKYQFKPTLPFSPGGEVSGVIESIGQNVKSFKPGDKVISFCTWGGMAEKVSVDASRVSPMPDGMDWITAATTLYAFGTSYHALKDRGQLKSGETLLVMGASGGVGLAAVNLGKIMGAKVIAASSNDEKLKVCRDHGADFLINTSNEDLKLRLKEITDGKGVNVVYDAVGGDLAEQALRSMAWGGRYLVVGFASGEIPSFPANLPLLKGCSVVGVFTSKFAEVEPESHKQNLIQLNSWIASGKIKSHIHKVYSLEESKQALRDLQERKVIGKAVVKIS